jgi:hypothetical protein
MAALGRVRKFARLLDSSSIDRTDLWGSATHGPSSVCLDVTIECRPRHITFRFFAFFGRDRPVSDSANLSLINDLRGKVTLDRFRHSFELRALIRL